MAADDDGLKSDKIVINQMIYGIIRTVEELEMVPIIGVEPTTFALRIRRYIIKPTIIMFYFSL